ncbi:MAG: hypothetical protein JNG88_17070 [Phycisphaerales bacterium]|nr:hypothetical protein [Phycisphaerales bacterium]
MRRFVQLAVLGFVSAATLIGMTGCAKDEHRKVQVREEEQRGEVVEESPGEMVVE